MAIKGGCRCGDVRYALARDALPRAYACHCLDCQTWSGSAFSEQVPVAESELTITAGTATLFELAHPDGDRVSHQRVCGRCHTRLYNTNTRRPGIAVVRAGTLDRSDEVNIVAHIWTKRKQPWLTLAADVPVWPESAPPAEFIAALA